MDKNRRQFMVATGSAAVVGASIAALDPVFGAIARHKALDAEYCAASCLTDEIAARQEGREVSDDDEAVMDHATQSERQALAEFLDTVPGSKAGCRAAIRYLAEIDFSGEYSGQFLASLLRSPVFAD